MSDYRVVIAVDMVAPDKETASTYGKEIAQAMLGLRRGRSRTGPKTTKIWKTDVIEVRDR